MTKEEYLRGFGNEFESEALPGACVRTRARFAAQVVHNIFFRIFYFPSARHRAQLKLKGRNQAHASPLTEIFVGEGEKGKGLCGRKLRGDTCDVRACHL